MLVTANKFKHTATCISINNSKNNLTQAHFSESNGISSEMVSCVMGNNKTSTITSLSPSMVENEEKKNKVNYKAFYITGKHNNTDSRVM